MQPEIIPPQPKSPSHFGWLSQINWGHGMIGKVTVAAVAALAVLGIIASRMPTESGLLIIALFVVMLVAGLLAFLGWFANRHPDLAATEGITYVQSRQITLAAKNAPMPTHTELLPDPQNPTHLNQAGAP